MFDNNNDVEDDQENEPPKPSTSTMKQQQQQQQPTNNSSQQHHHFVLPNWKHSAAKATANLDKILRDIEELNVGGFKKKVDNNSNTNDVDDGDNGNVWSMPLSPLSILRNIGGGSATTNNSKQKVSSPLDDDSTTEKKKKRQGAVTTAAVSSDGSLSKSTSSSSSTVPSSNNNNNNTPPQRQYKKKMTTAKDYREVLLKKKSRENSNNKKKKKEKKSDSINNLSPTPSTYSSQSTTVPYTSSSPKQHKTTTKDDNNKEEEEVINATVETVPTTELLDASDNAVRNIIQKVQDTIHDMNRKIELKEYELYKKGDSVKNEEMNVKRNVNENDVKGGEDELKRGKEVEEERQKAQLLKQKQEEAETRSRLEEETEKLRLKREQELVRKKQQEEEQEAERITKEMKERQSMIELVNGILQINNNNKNKKKEEQEYNGIYKILGLEYNASLSHIKKAYRKLALKLHPDKDKYSTPNANEAFQIVSHAYNVLVDPESRQEYDDYQLRTQQQQQQQPRSSYGRSNSQQQQQQQPIAWSKYNILPKGTRVTILTNDSKLSHFNGLQGCTIDHTTSNTNNNGGGLLYTIQMDGTSGTIIPSIKQEYLFQNVIVCLRASKIQELGLLQCGVFLVTLISYYKDNIGGCYQGRYTIDNTTANHGGGSGMTKMTYLRSEQFIIPNGTIVKVVVGNLPYQYGTIINWKEEERMHGSHVEDTSYYEVQLSLCNVIRVKMANVRL